MSKPSCSQRQVARFVVWGAGSGSRLDESLYHATLPGHGENHVGHLGPLFWSKTHTRGYLVLTSHRLIFVRAPTALKRSYQSIFEVRLDNVRSLSVVEGMLSSTFSTDAESFTVPHVGSPVKSHVVRGFRDIVARAREGFLEGKRQALAMSRQVAAPSRIKAELKTPAPAQVVREREIIKEIVKVPCRYCGNLVPVTASKCPTCSAPLAR